MRGVVLFPTKPWGVGDSENVTQPTPEQLERPYPRDRSG
jgi:hypothetical protein